MRRKGINPVLLSALLVAAWAPWALAAESLRLGSDLPGWTAVVDGAAREAVLDAVRPLARPHAFNCGAPEVFVDPEAATIEEALARYVPRLRPGIREDVVDETLAWRLAIVDAPDLMFERLSVLWVTPDGVWLLVC